MQIKEPTPARQGLWVKRGTLWLCCAIPIYFMLSMVMFFSWVNPSLTGETEQHIAADSHTYSYFADSLREGRNEPWVLASLAKFPNTLWGPVLLGLLIPSTVAIALTNYAILLFAIWLLHRAVDLDVSLLLLLILANVTTFISLLSLNKEILDLLVMALFVYYLGRGSQRGRRIALSAALLISTICRFETAVCIIAYLTLQSRWNILRSWRKASLVAVVLALSACLPSLISATMSARIDEAQATASSGGLLLLLDDLQMHYLFFVAVIPKIFDNLFAQLVSFNSWPSYSLDDAANTFFLFGNNLASLVVIVLLISQRRFKLRNNLVYFACLTAILMSTSPVIQPRYFYGAYIILCVEAARRWHPRSIMRTSSKRVNISLTATI
jgi:hypothetical protein